MPARGPGSARRLSVGQVRFIALGAAVGAGLFVASGQAIRQYGPGLIADYAVMGLVLLAVARALGEMALTEPGHTFVGYVARHLGPAAGLVCSWSYGVMMVLGAMAELSAFGTLAHGFLPALPQWAAVCGILLVLALVNLSPVRVFGTVESGIAVVKVAAIVGFVILGGAALLSAPILGWRGIGINNLWRHGGLFPAGLAGFAVALPFCMSAYGGAEVIGLVAAETEDPARAIPRAVNGLVARVLFFYVATMAVAMSVVPWNRLPVADGPFVAVLDRLGVPALGIGLHAVIATAVVSACNTMVFAIGRVIGSAAAEGLLPRALGRLDRHGVPRRAVLLAIAAVSGAVLLNQLLPDRIVLVLLLGGATLQAVNWMLFLHAHARFRRHCRARNVEPHFPLPGSPWSNRAALALIAAALAAMLVDPGTRPETAGCLLLFAALAVLARRATVGRPTAGRAPVAGR